MIDAVVRPQANVQRITTLAPKRFRLLLVLLAVLLVFGCIVSLLTGPVRIAPAEILTAILSNDRGLNGSVIFSIRLPRIAGAVLAGWALSLAGLTYQSLLRNPLASEYTLGIATGAALGALSAALIGVTGGIWSTFFAFLGSIATMMIVFLIARTGSLFDPHSLVLTGIILNAFGNALLSFILAILSPNQLHSFLFWFLGSLAVVQWTTLVSVFPFIFGGTLVIALMSWRMNAISIHEDLAYQIGVPVLQTKIILFLCSGLLTAVVVSFAGTIGFVGLVVPHMARLLVGADNRRLTLVVPLIGACLCIFADLLSRSLLAPAELPIGVVTAFLGVPFFLYFLARKKA